MIEKCLEKMIGRIGRIGEVEHSENCYTKVLRAHLDSTRISDSYPLRSKRSSFSFVERGLLRDDAQNFSRFRPERTFVVVEQSSKAFKACTAYIEAKQRVSHHLIAAMASTEDIRNFEAFSLNSLSSPEFPRAISTSLVRFRARSGNR